MRDVKTVLHGEPLTVRVAEHVFRAAWYIGVTNGLIVVDTSTGILNVPLVEGRVTDAAGRVLGVPEVELTE